LSQCPVCSKNVSITEANFGTLFTCTSCQGVFFVGWDGQPEVSDAGSDEVIPEPVLENPMAENISPALDFNPSNPLEGVSSGNDFQHINEPSPSFEAAPSSSEAAPQADGMEVMPSLDSFSAPPGFDAPAAGPKENFSDVVKFGNSLDDKGLITYTVTIQGIDLSSVLQQIKEALTDERFNWKADDLLGQIQNGELVIDSLSTAKAVVLVHRLKYLPVEVQWRQNVLTN